MEKSHTTIKFHINGVHPKSYTEIKLILPQVRRSR